MKLGHPSREVVEVLAFHRILFHGQGTKIRVLLVIFAVWIVQLERVEQGLDERVQIGLGDAVIARVVVAGVELVDGHILTEILGWVHGSHYLCDDLRWFLFLLSPLADVSYRWG